MEVVSSVFGFYTFVFAWERFIFVFRESFVQSWCVKNVFRVWFRFLVLSLWVILFLFKFRVEKLVYVIVCVKENFEVESNCFKGQFRQ